MIDDEPFPREPWHVQPRPFQEVTALDVGVGVIGDESAVVFTGPRDDGTVEIVAESHGRAARLAIDQMNFRTERAARSFTAACERLQDALSAMPRSVLADFASRFRRTSLLERAATAGCVTLGQLREALDAHDLPDVTAMSVAQLTNIGMSADQAAGAIRRSLNTSTIPARLRPPVSAPEHVDDSRPHDYAPDQCWKCDVKPGMEELDGACWGCWYSLTGKGPGT